MMRKRRVVSLMLVMVLCMGMTFQAQAANLSDAKKKAEELESKKEAAQSEKDSLSTQLEGILTESAELEKQIAEKEEELAQKEDELIEAQIDENNQYEDMKKRIKYMYENGNAEFMEILFQSETLSDFLNNAEYISTISEYDRDMLVEFQEIVKTVEEQEQAIQEEYDEMETMQNELVEKQNTVQQLIDTKSDEISDLDSEIAANKDEIASLEAARQMRQENSRRRIQVYLRTQELPLCQETECLLIHVRVTVVSPVTLDIVNSRLQEQVPTIRGWTLLRHRERRSMRLQPEQLLLRAIAARQERES